MWSPRDRTGLKTAHRGSYGQILALDDTSIPLTRSSSDFQRVPSLCGEKGEQARETYSDKGRNGHVTERHNASPEVVRC